MEYHLHHSAYHCRWVGEGLDLVNQVTIDLLLVALYLRERGRGKRERRGRGREEERGGGGETERGEEGEREKEREGRREEREG